MLNWLSSLSGHIETETVNRLYEKQLEKLQSSQFKSIVRSLQEIPQVFSTETRFEGGAFVVDGKPTDLSHYITQLGIWRKGPYEILGNKIESEWRSDLKWLRIQLALPVLKDKVVLDIGCNNGYYMFLMKLAGAKKVIGFDPIPMLHLQFKFINHFAQLENVYHALLGIEHLRFFEESFDIIFAMGILYHHPDPINILKSIFKALRPGGELVLETIGIPGDEEKILFPKNRYARMKNVWFVPSLSALINMLERCKFKEIQILATQWDKEKEQRSTTLVDIPSYKDFLDPVDPTKTIEGYQAPERFCLKCKK